MRRWAPSGDAAGANAGPKHTASMLQQKNNKILIIKSFKGRPGKVLKNSFEETKVRGESRAFPFIFACKKGQKCIETAKTLKKNPKPPRGV